VRLADLNIISSVKSNRNRKRRI